MLNNAQINILLAIAQQCPYAGGPAVYSARVLLKLCSLQIIYDDNTTCWAQGIFRKAAEEKKLQIVEEDQKFNVSPNPDSNELNIASNKLFAENTQLIIYNSSGNEVRTDILPATKLNVKISIRELSDGVYYLKIFEESNLIFLTKIVIIK